MQRFINIRFLYFKKSLDTIQFIGIVSNRLNDNKFLLSKEHGVGFVQTAL